MFGDSQLSFPPSLLTTLSKDVLFVTAKPDPSRAQRLLLARTTGRPQGCSLNSAVSCPEAGIPVRRAQWRVRTCRRTRSYTTFILSHLLGQLNMRHDNYSEAGVALETSITSQTLTQVPKSPSPHQRDRPPCQNQGSQRDQHMVPNDTGIVLGTRTFVGAESPKVQAHARLGPLQSGTRCP